jgi:hypothetical protein
VEFIHGIQMEGNTKRGIKTEEMKTEREVGRKEVATNSAAAATCDNRAFRNARSWMLWMHRFRDGNSDRQVASAR